LRRHPSKAAIEQRFHELLSLNGPALIRLAASYTNNRSDRDDLFQDIALAIWQALPRFRGESSERTFVFRIAHNRAITFLGQRWPAAIGDEEADLPDPRPNPERGFAEDQREARLFEAVHDLPMAYRQVITLTLEGLTYGEISEILGIGESNVGVRLNRARQMLRRRLEVHDER
jgi:RNA polymerase sigma factor (sigma-70 family)